VVIPGPKKVVERPHVPHRKLTLKGNDRALKEGNTRQREHDVIDVEQEVDGIITVLMDEQ
jgi:hypothetical protein